MILTRHDRRVRVARLTVEAVSPLHCGSGRGDDVSDADVLRDMNGLPTIAGTTLAGVLRSMFRAAGGAGSRESAIFGDQDRGSRLTVSFGLLLDGSGQVIEGHAPRDHADVILRMLRPLDMPLRRHVRITHRGVADAGGRGLFDERIVPAGARFIFELGLAGGGAAEDRDFDLLLDMIRGGIRVGGRTRRGLGRLRLVRAATRSFDLGIGTDRAAFAALPASLAAATNVLEAAAIDRTGVSERPAVRLVFRPRTPWAIGTDAPWEDAPHAEDISVYREPVIRWSPEGKGRIEQRVIVPATSIKGVLAHRVAWHANVAALCSGRAEDARAGRAGRDAVAILFGHEGSSAGDGAGEPDDAKAGILFVDDAAVDPTPDISETVLLHHSGIDRFTGGVREGVLFSERLMTPGRGFETLLEIDDCPDRDVPGFARDALRLAIDDLRRGRWHVGQGSGRGHGWVDGDAEWVRGAEWLTGGAR